MELELLAAVVDEAAGQRVYKTYKREPPVLMLSELERPKPAIVCDSRYLRPCLSVLYSLCDSIGAE